MFNVLVPRYYKIAAGGVRITYDVDDVCWDFVGRLCKRLGIHIVTGHRFMCPRIQILALS